MSLVIRWPHEEKLPASVRSNLERIRHGVPLLELQAAPETWTFELLPWSSEFPLWMRFRNERFEPLDIIVEEDGTWRRFRPPEVPRLTPEQLSPAA